MPRVAESDSTGQSLRHRFGPGIYLHIPFCGSRCGYCDFFVVLGGEDARERFVSHLVSEIEIAARSGEFSDLEFQTIFFGGGTPSLLSPAQMDRILSALRDHFSFAADVEVTAECNPESATNDKLHGYRNAGIERVSFGVQSMDEERLSVLDRAHSVDDVGRCLEGARAVGMSSASLDLIYGLPVGQPEPFPIHHGSGRGAGAGTDSENEAGQARRSDELELASWERTLEAALALGPDHLSAYLLALEPHVPLARKIRNGAIDLPEDDLCLRQYERLIERAEAAGLRRYEISNFSRPGHESRHNQNYWVRGDYLGLGPSAHSHRDGHRWSNVRSLAGYEESIASGKLPRSEPEALSAEEQGEEWIFLGLRRSEGVPLEVFDEHWSKGADRVRAALDRLGDHLEIEHGRLRLTPRSLFVSNTVFAELALALTEPMSKNETAMGRQKP